MRQQRHVSGYNRDSEPLVSTNPVHGVRDSEFRFPGTFPAPVRQVAPLVAASDTRAYRDLTPK